MRLGVSALFALWLIVFSSALSLSLSHCMQANPFKTDAVFWIDAQHRCNSIGQETDPDTHDLNVFNAGQLSVFLSRMGKVMVVTGKYSLNGEIHGFNGDAYAAYSGQKPGDVIDIVRSE